MSLFFRKTKMVVNDECWMNQHVPQLSKVRVNPKAWTHGSELAYGFGVFLSRQAKHDIPKLGALANSKLPILYPFQAITTSTTFWQNKWLGREDKKDGSWQFWWVLPMTHGFSPNRLKVNIPTSLSLGKSCPHLIIRCIAIAGCGFFMDLHIYMMFTNVLDSAQKP